MFEVLKSLVLAVAAGTELDNLAAFVVPQMDIRCPAAHKSLTKITVF